MQLPPQWRRLRHELARAMNGKDAMVTVLFADIRDFTPFADRVTAREAVALLNEFFGIVVPILEGHGGRVDKYLGDVMLGVFGAPRPLLGIIGDPVNVAARVEQATRATGDSVLVTEATRCMLEDPDGLVPRGAVDLRGKAAHVAVYAPASLVPGLGAAR